MSTPLPMIERRRIEAELLKEVYQTLQERVGTDEAKGIISEAVRRSAIRQANELAQQIEGGPSLQGFISIKPLWTAGDALETETVSQSETHFDYNVTRCRYAEMYRDMGLSEIGALLSCNRDGAFCEGFDPRLKLTRTQTIMEGASHCDFRYRYETETA